jgi:hypothetical protein
VSTLPLPDQHLVSTVKFGVLGPVTAGDGDGRPADLKGPRHRAVLARLIVARGRMVPLGVLIDDLWPVPPPGAPGAIRTFVGALRRALEPDRPPRSPSRLLITQGPGYALAAGPDDVDAWRFERLAGRAATAAPARVLELAAGADGLGGWRGPAWSNGRPRPGSPLASPPRPCRTWRPTPPTIRGGRTPGGCWLFRCTGADARPMRWR